MVLIGLGANLPTPAYGPPRAALGAALTAMQGDGIIVLKRAPWYETAPVPISDQPWYVNGVARVETRLTPSEMITYLLDIENRFGRVRTVQNAPRILDLDLLAYEDVVLRGTERSDLTLPHPRMYERAFVMRPLYDIAPDWRDPLSGRHIKTLIAALPAEQDMRKMNDAAGLFGTEWTDDAGTPGKVF